jgi:hypothetical protein
MGGIFFHFQPPGYGGIWGGYFSIFSLKRSTPCLTEVSPVKRSGGWSQSWMVTLLKELTFGGTAAG